jgi:preprotein translocase subunit YajC
MFWENLAFAMGPTPGGGAGGGQGNPIMAFLPLIILFVIFYFLLIRPQQKKAKEHKDMLSNLQRGDYVITGGGLYGRITSVSDQVLTLDIGNDMEVKVNRNYIASLAEKGSVEEKKQTKKNKNEK